MTRLLKVDQTKASYWLWLSAVVETRKERLYCLETAYKLDPTNAAARRGLVLLGALPPDENVKPFPLNRPRPWEDALVIPKEKAEKVRGWANPGVRLFTILALGLLVIGLAYGGYMVFTPALNRQALFVTATHRPTFTLSPTPSLTPVHRTATPTFLGPTPLSFFLRATFTQTPIYGTLEHPIMTSSLYEAGLRFLGAGQYDTARVQFDLVLNQEPDAADVYYFIGETYRLEADFRPARDAYQEAINRDLNYAPAYIGRALAILGLDPEADVLANFDNALSIDREYTEAYIQRGAYLIDRGLYRVAIDDLETAIEMEPGSAIAWMYLAQALLGDDQSEAALEAALRSNELDLTLVADYLTLAQAYVATGQTAEAVAVLQTYTIYEPEDVDAFLTLGTAYNAAGEYEAALEVLNSYIDENQRVAEAYYQRGLAHLNIGNSNLAEEDFKKAISYDPYDFDAQMGMGRAIFDQGDPGGAYVHTEKNAHPLAKTDYTKAQVHYWEAIFLEAIGEATSTLGARNSWYQLLALPVDVVPEEWRQTAFEHLGITPTFTPSPSRTRTPTKTPTPGS